jgi:kynurenine formamidase
VGHAARVASANVPPQANREVVGLFGRHVELIDLSDTVSNETADTEPNPHRIEYVRTEDSPAIAEQAFGIDRSVWPRTEGWAVETVTLSTHSGSHVDAPAHYGHRADGTAARTIDEVPLSWCCGDGVVLDMTHKRAGDGITDEDVIASLAELEYVLKPNDVVLVRTDASNHFGEPEYELRHAGLRRSATEWLVDRGVKLVGIDAWGLDRPFDVMLEEARTGSPEQFWESHLLGREKEYCQIERVSDLKRLPRPHGFWVAAFPVKLSAASAGWTRVVAFVPVDEA